jgi:hypothetical protein
VTHDHENPDLNVRLHFWFDETWPMYTVPPLSPQLDSAVRVVARDALRYYLYEQQRQIQALEARIAQLERPWWRRWLHR